MSAGGGGGMVKRTTTQQAASLGAAADKFEEEEACDPESSTPLSHSLRKATPTNESNRKPATHPAADFLGSEASSNNQLVPNSLQLMRRKPPVEPLGCITGTGEIFSPSAVVAFKRTPVGKLMAMKPGRMEVLMRFPITVVALLSGDLPVQ